MKRIPVILFALLLSISIAHAGYKPKARWIATDISLWGVNISTSADTVQKALDELNTVVVSSAIYSSTCSTATYAESAPGDNLGNHTATQDLNVAGYKITVSTLTLGEYTFPYSDGVAGQGLLTNGSGVLSWGSVGGGGSSSLSVEEDDVQVSSPTAAIDFRDGLDVSESPSGESNVVVDPDEVITAGTRLAWSGHTLNVDLATGVVTQAYDADLDDLADGTLSASKIEDKFLRNDGSDTTSGTITCAGITSSGQVTSSGNKLIDVYDWAVVITTPTWLGTDAVLVSPIRSFAVTITTITMITTGGTNFIGMIEQRPYASPHSAGTDIWTGDVTVSSTTWTTGTISDYTVPANYGLYLKPTSVSGPVKILTLRGIVSKD